MKRHSGTLIGYLCHTGDVTVITITRYFTWKPALLVSLFEESFSNKYKSSVSKKHL